MPAATSGGSPRRVLIVGGGIAGLAAAVELADDARFSVELREAGPRLGGKIASSAFGGVPSVDEGADAFLRRVPHAVEFAHRVGLSDAELTSPSAATASVWHERLHDIPGGIMLGVPASVKPFVATSLLSWRGKLRAAAEPFLPRTSTDEDSIGALIRSRFGDEVHERLVDALVGSIYATDTDNSSLAAMPQLAALADEHRSLLIGARAIRRRATGTPGAPIFATPVGGMSAIVDAAERYLGDRQVVVTTGSPVREVLRDGQGWRVDDRYYDDVVLATPARTTAPLLEVADPATAEALRQFEHADIIMVRLSVPSTGWPDRLHGRSGYLVPKPVQRYVTAASFGSQKWSHWRPDHGGQILRVSLGRDGLPTAHLDDSTVAEAAVEEVGRHIGLDLQPSHLSITRWPQAFAQYRPHHQQRVADLDRRLPAHLHLAGASYRGIGIPACIADGFRAAHKIQETTEIRR